MSEAIPAGKGKVEIEGLVTSSADEGGGKTHQQPLVRKWVHVYQI